MGSPLSQPKIPIVLVGLDECGKTTMLKTLKSPSDEIISNFLTIGFMIEKISFLPFEISSFSLGGQDKIRPFWWNSSLYGNKKAIIWVQDCADLDQERHDLAKNELQLLFDIGELYDLPLLVFANKQDRSEASGIEEVVEMLNLQNLNRPWQIFGSVGTDKQSLEEGLTWLHTVIQDPSSYSPHNFQAEKKTKNANKIQ